MIKSFFKIGTILMASILCNSFSQISFAQKQNYQSLLDTAFKNRTFCVVISNPISKIGLDERQLWYYSEYFKEHQKQSLDTIMLLDIIKHSKNPDTRKWTDMELPKMELVTSRTENIELEYPINKFHLKEKNVIEDFKIKVNQFNSTSTFNRNIYSFSRPVFDSSKHFAIIQWNNGHGGLGGGGGIVLYQFTGIAWKKLGSIIEWVY